MTKVVRAGAVTLTAALLLATSIAAVPEEPGADASLPWLGVYLADEVDGGIRIVAVVPGGPASAAGLRSGDLLIEAEGVQLGDQGALERVLGARPRGGGLSVGVLRDGRPRTFLVHPTARKSAWPFAAPRPLPDVVLAQPRVPSPGGGLGAKTVQLTDELRAHYGVPAGRGVLVVRVDERGVSRDAGIEVGDVVVEVGTQPVTTPLEVEVALARREPGVPLEIEVVRDRTTVVKRIPAAPPPMTRVPPAPRASEERVRSLERSIEVLERRLDELRRQLAEVKAESPDRQE